MVTVDWLDFAEEIKFRNRFFPQNNKILLAIDEMFDRHTETLEAGTKFYRARLIGLSDMNMNMQDKVLSGFSEKGSMPPDAQTATAQRASPEKIPYLYVAQDEYTALSETRPGILSFISLAKLGLIEGLKVFDLWFDINTTDMNSDFSQLAASFSAVIAEKEKDIDYLPMQYIAEYVKNKGADGIRYISLQSQGGKNIVIFKKGKVKFLQSKILYTQNLNYSFLDITSPENKPLVNTIKNSSLPKDFAERIKNTVIAIQAKKTKSNDNLMV